MYSYGQDDEKAAAATFPDLDVLHERKRARNHVKNEEREKKFKEEENAKKQIMLRQQEKANNDKEQNT